MHGWKPNSSAKLSISARMNRAPFIPWNPYGNDSRYCNRRDATSWLVQINVGVVATKYNAVDARTRERKNEMAGDRYWRAYRHIADLWTWICKFDEHMWPDSSRYIVHATCFFRASFLFACQLGVSVQVWPKIMYSAQVCHDAIHFHWIVRSNLLAANQAETMPIEMPWMADKTAANS